LWCWCVYAHISIIVGMLLFLTVVPGSEFLAKENSDLFWSFVEAVADVDIDSPKCE